MLEPKKLLDDLLAVRIPGFGGNVAENAVETGGLAKAGPVATGAVAALLLGTRTGRPLAQSALKIGGAAAIAGLAYQAYRNYRNGGQPTDPIDGGASVPMPAPEDTAFHPTRLPEGEEAFALVLVRAMIAASRADGMIDVSEHQAILDRTHALDVDGDVESFLSRELGRPIDLDQLIAAAKTDAQKIGFYAASRLAVNAISDGEQRYLDGLAKKLKLPQALVQHIEGCVLSLSS
ncbi:MAG TPA: DUF533 domain-containing protein [Rhizobiaceae bacterium]|nr:DUF533 domain-containing protein [Rhizobiaceae bacterium]